MSYWCEREVEVPNPQGVHVRPAHLIAQTANRFRAEITIRRDQDADINAKSIVQVLTLRAEKGAKLTLRASGDDAEEAVAALAELVGRGFDEM